jgi:hypothetical protein
VIEAHEVQDLIAAWWFNYDEAQFDVWPNLLTADVHFTSQTDTGTTSYEEFVRSDNRGRDAVLDWQGAHRRGSPYPLRHNGTNVHLVARGDTETTFASYLFVTQIADGGVSNLSTGIVRGTVRREDGHVRIASMHVVLDTQESVPLESRTA